MTTERSSENSILKPLPPIRRGTLVVHWLALAALAVAPVVEMPWLRWIAVGVLGVQTLANLSVRSLFLRNLQGLPCLTSPPPLCEDEFLPAISVIVPARNEAETIERGLRSLLAQDYPRFEIIAVNDGSTDETPSILDRFAAEDSRLRVFHNPPLDDGWQGKSSAVWHGVQMSVLDHPWLLFTDADAVFGSNALRNAIAVALRDDLDFLTAVPYLENGGIWEELVMPALWSGLVINARPGHLNDPASPPIGVGPFMLVKRDVYLESGGHARVADALPDDTCLACIVKATGARMGVVHGDAMVRVRIYSGLAAMTAALVRKMRIQNRQQPAFFEMRLTYTLLQEVLPFPLFAGGCIATALGGSQDLSWIFFTVAAFLAYASCAFAMRSFRAIAHMRPAIEWLHPLAGVLRIWFVVRAWKDERAGIPLTWRERTIDVPESPRED
jgi:chlorobactene glucosyltransferase